MTRWLRNKIDGTIYEWDRYLAANPKCEEVSEEVAFPEKFLTATISSRVAQFSEEIPAAEEVAEVVAALSVAKGVCFSMVLGIGGAPSGLPATTANAMELALGFLISEPLFSGMPCSIHVLIKSTLALGIMS